MALEGISDLQNESLYLSKNDRILLHLSPFRELEESQSHPEAQTQAGIAEGLGITVATLTSPMRKLAEEGVVNSRLGRVEDKPRRKTVYWLSPEGRKLVRDAERSLFSHPVEVHTLEGNTVICQLSEVNEVLGVHLTHSHLIALAINNKRKVAQGLHHHSRFLPELADPFAGRQQLLEQLSEWLSSQSPKVGALHGMAGVGKTAVARQLLSNFQIQYNQFWFTCTQWDTPELLLQQLYRWRSGDSETAYKQGGANLMIELQNCLSQLQFRGPSLVVIDGLDLLPPESIQFVLQMLQLAAADGPHWLITTRNVEALHGSRRGWPGLNWVVDGLGREESRIMWSNHPRGDEVWEQSGGHPLAMRWALGMDSQKNAATQVFVEKQVLSELDGNEIQLLRIASLNMGPVSVKDLLHQSGSTKERLSNLENRGLIQRSDEGSVQPQRLVSDSLVKGISPKVKRALHRKILKFYRNRGGNASLLRQIYHSLKAGQSAHAERILEDHGVRLVEEQRTEIMEVLRPLEDELSSSGKLNVKLMEAFVLLKRGSHDLLQQQVKEIERIVIDGIPLKLKANWVTLRVKLSMQGAWRGDWKKLQHELNEIEIEASFATAVAHNEIGVAAHQDGALDDARYHFERSFEIFTAHEMRGRSGKGGASNTLANLGILAFEEERREDALSQLDQAYMAAQSNEDKSTMAKCELFLGIFKRRTIGEGFTARDSLDHLQNSRLLFESVNDDEGNCRTLIEIAACHTDLAQLDQARRVLEDARLISVRFASGRMLQEIDILMQNLS